MISEWTNQVSVWNLLNYLQLALNGVILVTTVLFSNWIMIGLVAVGVNGLNIPVNSLSWQN